MKNLQIFSVALTLSAIFYACKDPVVTPDNTNNNTTSKTKQELLTSKNWKITSLVSSSTDVWALLVAACNKDDQYHFRTDDSLCKYDMASKCTVSDPDSTVSIYKLYNNNTQLILNVKLTSSITLNDTADILELNENSLKINAEYSGLPATIFFSHP